MTDQRASTWTAAIIVMGVSGAGKSTIGTLLSQRLNRPLIEGDSLHPAANIASPANRPVVSGARPPTRPA